MKKVAVLFPLNIDSLKRYIIAIQDISVKPLIVTTKSEWINSVHDVEFIIMDGSLSNAELISDALIKAGNVIGVIAGGEFSVELSELVSTRLNLIHSMSKSPKILRNKSLMRQEFSKFGVEQPCVIGLASSIEDVYALAEALEYPVISKPVDMAGSWFVCLNKNKEELCCNAKPIFSYTSAKATGLEFNGECLIEKYVDGQEYSVEVIVQNGKILDYIINRKYLSKLPYFDEIGHICGLMFNEDFDSKLVKNILGIINAAGVSNSIMHIEFRVDNDMNFNIIEAGCRIAGDRISNIVEAQHSISLEKIMVNLKLGKPVMLNRLPKNIFTGIRFLFNDNKSLPTDVKCIEEVIYNDVKVSNEVSETHISNRIGFQIISSENFLSLSEVIENV